VARAGFRWCLAGHFRSQQVRFHRGYSGIGRVLREVRDSSVVLLPCAPASVAVARHRLTADLIAAGIFDAAVGDAALVVSELLSNAILHARPLPGARLQVTWVLDGGSIEVTVSDGGSPTRPRLGHASVTNLGGRGLGIVEHLSHTWGVRADDLGLTVWAVLPAPLKDGVGSLL
jgi:anti-sigma regulatory factor (Ser/Thr protein kinase)